MTKNTPYKIVIEGITAKGQRFRPRDWSERMSGRLATVKNRRIHYSPLLQPMVNEQGNKCVLLDPALQTAHPNLYNSILKFARDNQLRIDQIYEENNQ